MAKIISKRERIETVEYAMHFDRVNGSGGWSFPCDEKGNLFPPKTDAAAANMLDCLMGVHETEAPYIHEWRHSYTQPAVAECDDCGSEVELCGFTNTCDSCGADYNMSGQRLAPRWQWGEETGETASDILGPDTGSDW